MKKAVIFCIVMYMVLFCSQSIYATEMNGVVEELSAQGIIQGYEDGSFGLDNNMTRAEFASMLVKMLKMENLAKNSQYRTVFTDVPSASWYTGYVNVVQGKNIIQGYENGEFRPNQKITYAEVVTLLVRQAYGSIDNGNWPMNYLLKGAELGITKGAVQEQVKSPVKRSQVFRMMYNTLFLGENGKAKSSKKANALVIENSYVASLEENYVVLRLIDDIELSNGVIEAGAEFGLNVSNDEEELLGKVVEVLFEGEKVKSIERIVDEYRYIVGMVDEIGEEEIEIEEDNYSVKEEVRYMDEESRLQQVYLNGEAVQYQKLLNVEEQIMAKITVCNGKVIFIEAYTFDSVAPILSIDIDDNKLRVAEDDNDILRIVRSRNQPIVGLAKNGEKYSFYEMSFNQIKPLDVIYYSDDAIMVYRSGVKSAKFEKVRRGPNQIALSGNMIPYNNEEGLKAVYSLNGKTYNVFDDKLDDVERFDEKNIEYVTDAEGNIQLFRKNRELDSMKFAMVKDVLANRILLRDPTHSKIEYSISIDAEFYKADLDDIYEDIDFEELNEKSKEIELENFKPSDLVYIDAKGTEIIRLYKLDLDDAWFTSTEVNEESIDIEEPVDEDYYEHDWYDVDSDTRMYVIRKNNDIGIYTVPLFLKSFKISSSFPMVGAIVPYRDQDDLAKVVFVKSDKLDVKVKERIYMVKDIEDMDDTYRITYLDENENEIKSMVRSAEVAKIIDRDGISEDDILQVEVTSNGNMDTMSINKLITASSKQIYKVVDIDGRNLTLGYGKDPNSEVADFGEDNVMTVYMSKNIKVFGNLDVGEFVTIHFTENEDVDVIREREEPNELTENGKGLFALVEVKLADRIDAFVKIIVKEASIGSKFWVDDMPKPYLYSNEAVIYTDEDEAEIRIVDEDDNVVGKIYIPVDESYEKNFEIIPKN